MVLINPASGCPGCGSRAIDAQGICEYCRTRVVLPVPAPAQDAAAPEAANRDLPAAGAGARQQRLEAELRFLEEQWADTAHPSLPAKIARIRQQLEDHTARPRSSP